MFENWKKKYGGEGSKAASRACQAQAWSWLIGEAAVVVMVVEVVQRGEVARAGEWMKLVAQAVPDGTGLNGTEATVDRFGNI
ncbi:hypothetical protein E2C01_002650 [Portunus trituberculatus]|uniref:Uncharacterized protein n=1 Tax=Portunus trituberculatus TaxID=210409 RepID=A0A5B7CMQ6_PORTR|nr:hypothetical protein [Portunus trituberculatus]